MNENKKPLSMVIRETTESIAKIFNSSGLPIDILVYIAQDIFNVCKQQAEISYKADVEQMNNNNNNNKEDNIDKN